MALMVKPLMPSLRVRTRYSEAVSNPSLARHMITQQSEIKNKDKITINIYCLIIHSWFKEYFYSPVL